MSDGDLKGIGRRGCADVAARYMNTITIVAASLSVAVKVISQNPSGFNLCATSVNSVPPW
jgi:hypothetical protein